MFAQNAKRGNKIGRGSMELNLHKKMTFEDKFARKYYCKKASRNYTRFAKRYNRRKFRRANKRVVEKGEGE